MCVSDAGRDLFKVYILEALADADKRSGTIDDHVRELGARSTAADIRLHDIEEEVGQIREALANHLLADTPCARKLSKQ
jgi:hypothetical protein